MELLLSLIAVVVVVDLSSISLLVDSLLEFCGEHGRNSGSTTPSSHSYPCLRQESASLSSDDVCKVVNT